VVSLFFFHRSFSPSSSTRVFDEQLFSERCNRFFAENSEPFHNFDTTSAMCGFAQLAMWVRTGCKASLAPLTEQGHD
jgi:hypothetical protein